jgi:hypothetical protein
MAAIGEIRWPPLGRNRWPLTDPLDGKMRQVYLRYA